MRTCKVLHTILVVLLGLFCITLIQSCDSKARSVHLKLILDRPANPNHIPLYVGHAMGYFRDEGIFLDIHKPQTDKPLEQLDNKSADLVLASLPRVFRAIARKSNIYLVGKLVDAPLKGFLVLQRSGMKTISDFNGRIMGYDGAYSILPSAEVLLDHNNVQVGCRLNLCDEAINELVSNKIDIVYGALANLEPEYLKFLGHKVRFFLVSNLGMPDYEEVVIAAHAGVQTAIPAFQKALQRSIDFCREKPQLAFEMYANILQNKNRKTLAWEESSWNLTIPMLSKEQTFSYTSAKTLADWQYDNGLVGAPVDVTRCFIPKLQKET